jgi:single-stranded-DNA-specific exonuclease
MEWRLKEQAPADFLDKFSQHDILTKNLFWQRGLKDEAAIERFFNFDYQKNLHSPRLLKNIEQVVERILKALRNKEKVVIWGDYDVDGVSSSVMLVEIFKKIDIDYHVHIPDRNKDGYGLNLKGIEEAAKIGAKLVIAVDCGMSDFEEVERAASLGLEVIIIDHHLVTRGLPQPAIIVNPWQEGDEYPFKDLAACGVVFKATCALIEKLRDEGFEDKFPEGYEKWFLDLVAMATIADSEPLLGENRTLVKYGFLVLARTRRVGLQALMTSASIEPKIINKESLETNLDFYTVAFMLAPRINAASRMEHANISFRLLETEDLVEAKALAQKLETKNRERQKVVEKILKEINGRIDENNLPAAVILGSATWSVGVLGLVAGKLAEKFMVPTFIYELREDEIIGSARAPEGFNLVEVLNACSEFLGEYGGHEQAAGFRLKPENISKFEKCLLTTSVKLLKNKLKPYLEIDSEVDFEDVDFDLLKEINKFRPFGQKNPMPKFLIKNLEVVESRLVGNGGKHLKMKLGNNKSEKNLNAIYFGQSTIEEHHKKGERIDVVAEIIQDEYNGYLNLTLKIVDLKPSDS